MVLNKLKIRGNSTSIYTYGAFSLKTILDFQPTCDPCEPMCEL
jgi:hypothetical protein